MRYCIFLLAAMALAQDFENDKVKARTITLKPGHKSPLHNHPANRVLVFLDAGKERLSTPGGRSETETFKAGRVQFSPASPAQHFSESLAKKPFRIVEITLKNEGGPASLNPLDPVKTDPKHYKVELENQQVRVIRARYGARETGLLHEHAGNRVVVFLTDYNLQITNPDGKVAIAQGKAGATSWGATSRHTEVNLNNKVFEVIAVDIR